MGVLLAILEIGNDIVKTVFGRKPSPEEARRLAEEQRRELRRLLITIGVVVIGFSVCAFFFVRFLEGANR